VKFVFVDDCKEFGHLFSLLFLWSSSLKSIGILWWYFLLPDHVCFFKTFCCRLLY